MVVSEVAKAFGSIVTVTYRTTLLVNRNGVSSVITTMLAHLAL